MKSPGAYLITFTTYGTWLPGDGRSFVDRKHNRPDEPFGAPDPERRRTAEKRLKHPPLLLDAPQRQRVLEAILEVCLHRGWWAHAVHVRTNHVHAVVSAAAKPEKVMTDFKAYSTRGLRQSGLLSAGGDRVWTKHGSTRYLWTDEKIRRAIIYVRDEQGDRLAYGEGSPPGPDPPSPDREGGDAPNRPVADAPGSVPIPTPCLIALGGNVGSVRRTFENALERLERDEAVQLDAVSRCYRTGPVGAHVGGTFLNAVAAIETTLPPLELLERLQSTEAACGRVREDEESTQRKQLPHGSQGGGPRAASKIWKPRPLDLDLVLYGAAVIDEPRLQLPHPACWYRRFVLDPLVDIAAETVHPVRGVTFGELRGRLMARPLEVAFAGGTKAEGERIRMAIETEFPEARFGEWSTAEISEARPTFIAWLGRSPGETNDAAFENLPRVPRLDLSREDDPAAFLRHVLDAALGRGGIEPDG